MATANKATVRRVSAKGRGVSLATSKSMPKGNPATAIANNFDRLSISSARKASQVHKEKSNFFDNIAKQKEEAAKAKKK